MSVAEESSAACGGAEFRYGVGALDGYGVPEVWSEDVEEDLVDTTAEGQVVLGQVVSDELC